MLITSKMHTESPKTSYPWGAMVNPGLSALIRLKKAEKSTDVSILKSKLSPVRAEMFSNALFIDPKGKRPPLF